jgi:peptidoglycan/LPS O-acetylase OafA/YrhL
LKYFSAFIVVSFLLAISSTFLIDMPFTHPTRLAELSLAAFGVVGVLSSNPRVHGAMAICVIGFAVFVSSVVIFEPGSLTR